MIRKIWFSLLLPAMAITACQPGTSKLTEQQKASIVAEVNAAANLWWSSWQTMDFEQGMSFISHAPEASFVGNKQILYGVAAMREDWSSWAAGVHEQDITITDSGTIVLAPDIVYTIRKYTSVQTLADDTITPELTGVETLVWVKRDGEWKILFDHETALMDSWQTLLTLESDQ